MITPARYAVLKAFCRWAGYGRDIDWSEQLAPPTTPDVFALEAAYVIINSGMRWTVALGIWERVRPLLEAGLPITGSGAFKHPGKVAAIDRIWADRAALCASYLTLETDEARLAFLEALPWVGPITKFHLGKNLGLDVAKPDRWLARLAAIHQQPVQAFCRSLAEASGDQVVVVDTVLWRVCECGGILIENGTIRPGWPWLMEHWDD